LNKALGEPVTENAAAFVWVLGGSFESGSVGAVIQLWARQIPEVRPLIGIDPKVPLGETPLVPVLRPWHGFNLGAPIADPAIEGTYGAFGGVGGAPASSHAVNLPK